jgi:hypothetical protein
MILDAFIFYNELELLDLRFRELYDEVDWFILVEATQTFRGNPKPLYFQENKDRYLPYLSKIVHVVVDDMPSNTDAWGREAHQRDAIARGVDTINPPEDAILLLSDVDEIPDMGAIRSTPILDVQSLQQDFYYYTMTWKHQDMWTAARALPIRLFRQPNATANTIRMSPTSSPPIPYAGWHFSYFGDIAFIRKKIESFSHQEFNFERYKNADHLEECIRTGNDLFFRADKQLRYVPVDLNPYLPRTLRDGSRTNTQ